ncbi:hypothetical protein BDV93DRAFT_606841 [Ceratobasidium sp. AG-I]|nr:hypothetical protein BDV93DRAFT_606841 [Ceratobasidium sp. AG-I]
MTTIPGDNQACCTLPPAQSDYQPKGLLETIHGVGTYGCDLLASQGFYVLLPDLLGKHAVNPNDIPTNTTDRMKRRQEFFAGVGNANTHLPTYKKIAEELKAEGFSIGTIGYCWGGRLAVLAGATDLYSAVALAHPSMLTPEDAANCKAALALYPTKDEDPSAMEPFVKIASDYKLYSETFHGFAAARANLEDPVHKAAYEDVYKRMSAFFKKHLLPSA